MGQDFQISVF